MDDTIVKLTEALVEVTEAYNLLLAKHVKLLTEERDSLEVAEFLNNTPSIDLYGDLG